MSRRPDKADHGHERVSDPLDELQARQFARKLYSAMRAKDLRASDLARLVWGEHPDGSARNRDRISVYINGKALPERENLEAIARALDVDPEELLPSAKPLGGEPELQIVLVPHDSAHAVFKCNKRMSLVLACRLAALIAEEDELTRTRKKSPSQSASGPFAVRQPDEELADNG
jgi:transcriptional regulator with XRE-family HTH domain